MNFKFTQKKTLNCHIRIIQKFNFYILINQIISEINSQIWRHATATSGPPVQSVDPLCAIITAQHNGGNFNGRREYLSKAINRSVAAANCRRVSHSFSTPRLIIQNGTASNIINWRENVKRSDAAEVRVTKCAFVDFRLCLSLKSDKLK